MLELVGHAEPEPGVAGASFIADQQKPNFPGRTISVTSLLSLADRELSEAKQKQTLNAGVLREVLPLAQKRLRALEDAGVTEVVVGAAGEKRRLAGASKRAEGCACAQSR